MFEIKIEVITITNHPMTFFLNKARLPFIRRVVINIKENTNFNSLRPYSKQITEYAMQKNDP